MLKLVILALSFKTFVYFVHDFFDREGHNCCFLHCYQSAGIMSILKNSRVKTEKGQMKSWRLQSC